MLVSSSKEKSLKFWRLPNEWRDKRLEQEHMSQVEKEEREQNILKSQQSMQRKYNDSEEEDDLAGWHK